MRNLWAFLTTLFSSSHTVAEESKKRADELLKRADQRAADVAACKKESTEKHTLVQAQSTDSIMGMQRVSEALEETTFELNGKKQMAPADEKRKVVEEKFKELGWL